MAKSDIEWTDNVWNPVHGCKAISPGCANCYAEPLTARLERMGQKSYAGLTKPGSGGRKLRVWTGEFREVPEMLDAPLHWKKPRTGFVNSTSDLFGEGVSNEFIAAVFGVMAATPRHTYQVLTKRAERLPEWAAWVAKRIVDGRRMFPHDDDGWMARQLFRSSVCRYPVHDVPQNHGGPWPLPNVWLGVSVEDRKHGLPRIEHLRRTPSAVRFLSIEPLLEDLGTIDLTGIHWVIVGGESGHGARPMHPDWARSVRDQCIAAKVPFFFKQWGEWAPAARERRGSVMVDRLELTAGSKQIHPAWHSWPDNTASAKTGKKPAGRILDGRTWDEMPAMAT